MQSVGPALPSSTGVLQPKRSLSAWQTPVVAAGAQLAVEGEELKTSAAVAAVRVQNRTSRSCPGRRRYTTTTLQTHRDTIQKGIASRREGRD